MYDHKKQKLYCVKVIFLLLFCYLLLGFSSIVLSKLYELHYLTERLQAFFFSNGKTGLNFLIYSLLTILAILFFGKDLLCFVKEFVTTPRRPLTKNIGITVFIGLCSILTQGISVSILSDFGILSENQTRLETAISQCDGGYTVATFMFMVLFGPFVEEVIYRYGFLGMFRHRKWTLGCALSSALFGLGHIWVYVIFDQDWSQCFVAIPYAILGIGFCLIYNKTKNFCYPLLLHMSINLLPFLKSIACVKP